MKLLTYSHFHDRGAYHIETSSLICNADQWIGFYMRGASVMKEFVEIISVEDQKRIENPFEYL